MIILYIVLGLFLGMLLVLLGNTARKTAKARKLTGPHPQACPSQLEETARVLQRMIRCKTVSHKDSYDDGEFARLRAVVREEFPLLHEKAQRMTFSDDFWLYKLPGKDPTRNILLMAHHDVVAADEEWTHDPFAGVVEDGVIHGRGTADTKGALCGILMGIEALLKEGKDPPVNVYIGSSHNEELGGDGVTTARSWFLDQGITFEVVLDEGGAIIDPPLGNMNCEMCAMVAVHEKGRCRIQCTAHAASSHVSLTGFKDNPLERMAAFIQEVTSKNIFLRELNPQIRAMFESLAPYCGFPMNVLFCNLWLFGGLIRRVLPRINATAGGIIGTTCSFQTLQGVANDKLCTATALLRNINPQSLDQDLDTLRVVAQKYDISLDVQYREYYDPANMESPAYQHTLDCLSRIFPRYPAAPYILPAGTDAWKLTPVCGCVLRFAPTRMNKPQLASIHAANENLDVSAVYEASVFYKHFVETYS